MHSKNHISTTDPSSGRRSLSEQFADAMNPQEESLYLSWMKKQFWSIDEFSALMGGIIPENYKNGTKGSTKITDEAFAKRHEFATTIFTKFLDGMEKTKIHRDFTICNENMFMTSWKFIKWVALNNMPIKNRFFKALPLALKELFFEFQPTNVALRTASRFSREYHKALYLDNAQKLIEEFPNMTPSEVYRHPRMDYIKRQIRELGGSYKKRTFLESWLPEVIQSPIGRPSKKTS